MKKFFTSFIFTLAFAAYGTYQSLGNFNTSKYIAPKTSSSTKLLTSNGTLLSVPSPTPKSNQKIVTTKIPPTSSSVFTPTPKQTGQYSDGTYTGSVADAYYGNVQIQASVSGGKITEVVFLQYPNDRGHSVSLNNYAMPILKSEAIQAQSAQVNTVSGASDTSNAFRESLGVALAQAKN